MYYFEKELLLLVSECILDFKKDHTFQFHLACVKAGSLAKIRLVSNGVQFTTVPKHDSWEALTEDNT